MSEAPDLEALAERYLDLWERQLAAMAAGPDAATGLAAFAAALGQAAFGTANEEPPRAGPHPPDAEC